MIANTALTGMQVITKVVKSWGLGTPDNLIDYTQDARVEPLTIVDAALLQYENTPDVTQSVLSIFSAYYLMAWHMMTVNVNNIAVMNQLSKLNPNRKLTAGILASMEGLQYALPQPSMEANNTSTASGTNTTGPNTTQNNGQPRNVVNFGSGLDKNISTVMEQSNLSVGKLLNVDVSQGDRKATLPIQIRLMTHSAPTISVVDLLVGASGENTSMWERYHAWRAGQLRFIDDVILGKDLIDRHRRNLFKDKSGILQTITDRARSGKFTALLSGTPSVATASSLLLVASTTIEQVEARLNMKFSNFAAREKVFKETNLMVVAVVDTVYDRVVFYHRGISLPTEASIRELKASNKGTGPNVSDILKAYTLGNAPSF